MRTGASDGGASSPVELKEGTGAEGCPARSCNAGRRVAGHLLGGGAGRRGAGERVQRRPGTDEVSGAESRPGAPPKQLWPVETGGRTVVCQALTLSPRGQTGWLDLGGRCMGAQALCRWEFGTWRHRARVRRSYVQACSETRLPRLRGPGAVAGLVCHLYASPLSPPRPHSGCC